MIYYQLAKQVYRSYGYGYLLFSIGAGLVFLIGILAFSSLSLYLRRYDVPTLVLRLRNSALNPRESEAVFVESRIKWISRTSLMFIVFTIISFPFLVIWTYLIIKGEIIVSSWKAYPLYATLVLDTGFLILLAGHIKLRTVLREYLNNIKQAAKDKTD